MNETPVNCDKCKEDFVINAIELEKFDGGIKRNYFICPHCQEWSSPHLVDIEKNT